MSLNEYQLRAIGERLAAARDQAARRMNRATPDTIDHYVNGVRATIRALIRDVEALLAECERRELEPGREAPP